MLMGCAPLDDGLRAVEHRLDDACGFLVAGGLRLL
jgi:hypothetical protein